MPARCLELAERKYVLVFSSISLVPIAATELVQDEEAAADAIIELAESGALAGTSTTL
jgi:hypothetical protein